MKHEQLKAQLVGPLHTVYTGFDENFKLDFDAIGRHIEFMAKNGAKTFYVMPYNSRYSQLREQEIFDLNQRCIEFIKRHPGTIAIVSDCIHGPSELSVEMGLAAKAAGVDIFASIVREKFFCVEQIVAHYDYLSQQLDMPLLVHEMPLLSGYNSANINWPMELWEALTKVEDIIAVKEDTKDVAYAI